MITMKNIEHCLIQDTGEACPLYTEGICKAPNPDMNNTRKVPICINISKDTDVYEYIRQYNAEKSHYLSAKEADKLDKELLEKRRVAYERKEFLRNFCAYEIALIKIVKRKLKQLNKIKEDTEIETEIKNLFNELNRNDTRTTVEELAPALIKDIEDTTNIYHDLKVKLDIQLKLGREQKEYQDIKIREDEEDNKDI